MKTLVRISAFLACALLTGCGGSTSSSNNTIPSAALSTDAIRIGDKITVQLTGVPDGGFFVEKQIPASGDFSLPILTQSFHAVGKTTAQLTQELTDAYKAQKIYTNPVVNVLAEERYIIVGGDVRSPSNVAYREGITMIGTITAAGGFTEFANRRAVRVIRGNQVFFVDCVKAALEPGADPLVYPGDQIVVPRTPF